MKTDEIRLWYEYNYWANARILSASAGLSEEQLRADTGFGSIYAALFHMMEGERGWRLGFQRYFVKAGEPVQNTPEWDFPELAAADYPTVDALREAWVDEERAMRAYLDGLSDEDLEGRLCYGIGGGIVRERVLWHCLLHLVNHGTQHRSEAAALLTSFGQSPGGMDVTLFLNEFYHLPMPD